MKYCGIIIVRGGTNFMAFVGNPYPWIYIPTNLFTILIKTVPIYTTNKTKSQQTRNILGTHEHWPPGIQMFTVLLSIDLWSVSSYCVLKPLIFLLSFEVQKKETQWLKSQGQKKPRSSMKSKVKQIYMTQCGHTKEHSNW